MWQSPYVFFFAGCRIIALVSHQSDTSLRLLWRAVSADCMLLFSPASVERWVISEESVTYFTIWHSWWKVINEYTKQKWPKHRTLGNSRCHQSFRWGIAVLRKNILCLVCKIIIIIIIFIFINPLTARVVRVPQIILQPVFSIFPVLHCPFGLAELQACPFPHVVFPPLPLSALSSSPFSMVDWA